jgi:hypothetical protein
MLFGRKKDPKIFSLHYGLPAGLTASGNTISESIEAPSGNVTVLQAMVILFIVEY